MTRRSKSSAAVSRRTASTEAPRIAAVAVRKTVNFIVRVFYYYKSFFSIDLLDYKRQKAKARISIAVFTAFKNNQLKFLNYLKP